MSTNNQLQRAVLLIRLVCCGFLVFAFCWWLAVIPALDGPARFILDVSDWPFDGNFDDMHRASRFLSAIGSGLLVGLSVLLLFVVVPEIKRRNANVVRGAVFAVLAWYVVDSLGCALLGIYSNVVLNTVYAAAIIPPLLMAGRAIKHS